MKVRIDIDERYPDYRVNPKTGDITVDVDQSAVRRWRRIERAYDRIQREMRNAHAGRSLDYLEPGEKP